MYSAQQQKRPRKTMRERLAALLRLLVVVGIIFGGWRLYTTFAQPSTEELLDQYLSFSEEVNQEVQDSIRNYALENNIRLYSGLALSIEPQYTKPAENRIVTVLVPVAEQYAVQRTIEGGLEGLYEAVDESPDYRLVDVYELTPEDTLLDVAGEYYLETFNSGAVFESLKIEGVQQAEFDLFSTGYEALSPENVFSMHTTGVTALTREMMNDLNAGVEPTFFSDKIGEFLAAADITHVSNEVSFKEGCSYSATLFCSPPEFIETLKASGVDVVEITGNHNNDVGASFNTSTLQQYKELGWEYVGGGLNDEDATKPYIIEKDGTTFGMLAYNYPDAPNGGAISGPDKAGANAYSTEKMRSDVASLREQVDFVQVNIQFWECYAYPDGYVEFPECDVPIGQQEPVFKSVIDAGADMVVGSSAHQPQTYEQYNDGWIYYGLGNLYFDQDRWPGTERGIVLTNYFHNGALLQTRITPTVYGSDFQTRKMTAEESQYLLQRLNDAR